MAITSWPFNDQDTSETEFSRWARNLRQTGVEGDPDGSALRPYGDSSGLVVKVPAGFAIVRGFAILSTAEESLAITAGGGQPRIDRIVARLDPTANEIELVVLAGTPGVSPVAPSLEQTDAGIYEMPLARVLVDAGASTISADKVTDEREFIGSDVGGWTTANRPLAPRKGQLGLNFTTSVFEWWTGTQWAQLTPTSLSASVITSGTLSADRLPTVPITKGGTGATTAAAARTALEAAAASHSHDWDSITGKPSSFTPASHNHSASNITSGTITRPVSTSGDGRFGAAWNNDVGSVTRRSVWMSSDGTLGHTASSKRYKQAIRRAETDPEAILSLEAKYYAPRGKGWQKEQDHEPTYIGLIAEDLHDAGLWEFIWYDDQGRPDGIHYELLGVAALIAAKHIAGRVSALEEAVAKLTGEEEQA